MSLFFLVRNVESDSNMRIGRFSIASKLRKGLHTCIVSSAPTFADPRVSTERVLFSDRARGGQKCLQGTVAALDSPDDLPGDAVCGHRYLSIDDQFLSAIHFPSIPLYYAFRGPTCLMFFRCYPPLAIPVPLLYQNVVCVLNDEKRMN